MEQINTASRMALSRFGIVSIYRNQETGTIPTGKGKIAFALFRRTLVINDPRYFPTGGE